MAAFVRHSVPTPAKMGERTHGYAQRNLATTPRAAPTPATAAITSAAPERAFVRAYAPAQKVACSCKRTWSMGPVIAEL